MTKTQASLCVRECLNSEDPSLTPNAVMRNAEEEVCGRWAEGGDGDGEVGVVVEFEIEWSVETRRRGAAQRSGRRDWESTSAAGEAAAACSGMRAVCVLRAAISAVSALGAASAWVQCSAVQYNAADNSKNRMSDG